MPHRSMRTMNVRTHFRQQYLLESHVIRRDGPQGRFFDMPKKAISKTASDKPKFAQVRIVLNEVADVPSYYVNYAEVSQGMHDFSIHVARMPSRFSPDVAAAAAKEGVLRIDPMLQLVVPPTIIPGLIKALELQKAMYEKQHGEIVDPTDSPPKALS